jgi:nucleoid-associated protein Lsr2
MARKVVFVDDLDGTEIPEGQGGTITFSVRGEFYELDLGEKSQAKLDKALDPFISKATKVAAPHSAVPARPTKRTTKVPGAGRDYLDAVRRWANDNGYTVSNRGRIAANIVEAYEQAKGK